MSSYTWYIMQMQEVVATVHIRYRHDLTSELVLIQGKDTTLVLEEGSVASLCRTLRQLPNKFPDPQIFLMECLL